MLRTPKHRPSPTSRTAAVGPLVLTAMLLAAANAWPADPAPVTAPPGLSVVMTLHAEGAQVYECRSGANGTLAWQFREPIATLLEGGTTVGRHFAGPSWQLAEGGATLVGRVAERLPGAAPGAIPWLRLDITERRDSNHGSRLSSATAILRVNTVGGVAEGACPTAGAFRSVPYAADYMVLKPGP